MLLGQIANQNINRDFLKDFVVTWYGNTGRCLKAFSTVYLLRNDQKTFSKNFEFINPTFSPKEKIIRGICYGHPGETEMYKYNGTMKQLIRWNTSLMKQMSKERKQEKLLFQQIDRMAAILKY